MPIIVELTEDQQDAIAPLLVKVSDAEDAGAPGMLLAQVFRGEMVVHFVPNDKARAIQQAVGGKVGETTRENDPRKLASRGG